MGVNEVEAREKRYTVAIYSDDVEFCSGYYTILQSFYWRGLRLQGLNEENQILPTDHIHLVLEIKPGCGIYSSRSPVTPLKFHLPFPAIA